MPLFEMGNMPLELNAVPSSLLAVGLTNARTKVVIAQCAGDGTPWQITVADRKTAMFIAKQILARIDELEDD